MTMAIDFGTCNTVIARWNNALRRVETPRFENMTKIYRYLPPTATLERESAVIPSLIHYGEGDNLYTGVQVENTGLANHRGTFRWLKLDLLKGNNRARRINGELITPRQAGEDFISQVILASGCQSEEELVITVPVEAYDFYVDWLQAAVQQNFQGTVRMLDEATACILGYDAHIREGQIYVVFDFGGGTLDVSVVKTLDLSSNDTHQCQVLGRAGEEIGGSLVDQWLLRELQYAENLSDQDLADIGTALLQTVEEAKVRMSSGEETVEVTQFNDLSGRLVSHSFTAKNLRRLLERYQEALGGRSLYQLIALTVERALETALTKYNIKKSEIKAVFMAGGSSLLLGVAEMLRTLFPNSTVHCEDPFEAIARGACRYAGEDISLALVHDYCLQSWNRERKDYELVAIAPKGTRYPTEKPVAVKYLNAACDGTTRLGMIVIERASMVRPEIIYEMDGGQLKAVKTLRRDDVNLRELNPADREFIHADPPCTVGSRRFVAGFGIDANKRLTLSLKDLEAGNRSYVQLNTGERLPLPIRDLPFVKL